MSAENKEDQVFEIGEDTVLAMRSQEFELDELGTIVARPQRPPLKTVTEASEIAPDLPVRFSRFERRMQEIQEFLRSLEAGLR